MDLPVNHALRKSIGNYKVRYEQLGNEHLGFVFSDVVPFFLLKPRLQKTSSQKNLEGLKEEVTDTAAWLAV